MTELHRPGTPSEPRRFAIKHEQLHEGQECVPTTGQLPFSSCAECSSQDCLPPLVVLATTSSTFEGLLARISGHRDFDEQPSTMPDEVGDATLNRLRTTI